MLSTLGYCDANRPMSLTRTHQEQKSRRTALLKISPVFLVLLRRAPPCVPLRLQDHSEPSQAISIHIEAPVADVIKAVEGITQDQIIHGTTSYEKERVLYGAHSASSVKAFGPWQGQGQVFYKVADKILAPRFFKDTGDIGTIYVRYVVTEAASQRRDPPD